MLSNLYPENRPYPKPYECPRAIILRRNNGINGFKILKPSFLTTFFCFLIVLFFITKTTSAQGPCPGSNCTSGDIRITKVELLQADGSALPNSCTQGQTNVQVELKVTFDVTSNTRYGFLVVAQVYINNILSGTIANCDPSTFSQGSQIMYVDHYSNGQPIIWPCGSTIQLKSVYTAWDQQVTTSGDYSHSYITDN